MRLSAWDRDAVQGRRARADLRRRRRVRRRGAGVSISGAQISDRDAALGAADIGLRDHRAQRRPVGVERAHGRHEPSAPIRRPAGQFAAAVAGHCESAADDNRRRRERRGRRPARRRGRNAKRRQARLAVRGPDGPHSVGAEPTTITLVGAPRTRSPSKISISRRATAPGACCRATASNSASSRASAGAHAVALRDGRRGARHPRRA